MSTGVNTKNNTEYKGSLLDLEDTTDDDYFFKLSNGDVLSGSLENFTASKLWDLKIYLHNLVTQ